MPNQNSYICSRHFTSDCYPANYSLKERFNIPIKNTCLNKGAVPTIQKHEFSRSTTAAASKQNLSTRPRPLASVPSSTVMATSSCIGQTTAGCTVTTVTASITSPITSASAVSIPGLDVAVVRGAYAKRERQRHLQTQTAIDGGQQPMPKKHKNTRTQVYIPQRHKGVQFCPAQKSVQVQCNLDLDCTYIPPAHGPVPTETTEQEVEEQMDCESENCATECDTSTDYIPPVEEEAGDSEEDTDFEAERNHPSVYLVHHAKLLELFSKCSACGQPAYGKVTHQAGSFICVQQECASCSFVFWWDSQPRIKNIPSGILLISAGILFSGSLPSKALRFLRHMGVACISDDSYFDHQRAFLFPAIERVWENHQAAYIGAVKDRNTPLTLGGDGRADTPGHCAKFGTYTLMDQDYMMVVDLEVVQSSVAGGSACMEKCGFLQSLDFINKNDLTIAELVTDHHPQIIKYMRELRERQKQNELETKHSVDVLHVGKGLKKKLVALGKFKTCQPVNEWVKSIVNHLYWVAVSTPNGDTELMLEKWSSLVNHVHDVHQHDGPTFPACQHSELTEDVQRKKWLKFGTILSVKLEGILLSKQMKKDIPMLSTGPQTAVIESFHSVLNHFAPKMIGFSYEGMLHRNILAALHFNENTNREQSQTKKGLYRYRLAPRKARKEFCVEEVKVDNTYHYVKNLMGIVHQLASMHTLAEMEEKLKERPKAPAPLSKAYPKQKKEDAVAAFRSRYKQT